MQAQQEGDALAMLYHPALAADKSALPSSLKSKPLEEFNENLLLGIEI